LTALNEADTCHLRVTPKLQASGWDTVPASSISAIRSIARLEAIFEGLAEQATDSDVRELRQNFGSRYCDLWRVTLWAAQS
jgi:hypothetical protein